MAALSNLAESFFPTGPVARVGCYTKALVLVSHGLPGFVLVGPATRMGQSGKL